MVFKSVEELEKLNKELEYVITKNKEKIEVLHAKYVEGDTALNPNRVFVKGDKPSYKVEHFLDEKTKIENVIDSLIKEKNLVEELITAFYEIAKKGTDEENLLRFMKNYKGMNITESVKQVARKTGKAERTIWKIWKKMKKKQKK